METKKFPVNTPKHSIKGVHKNFFHELSLKAENEDNFICWTRDYEWADDRKREVLKSYWLHAAGKTPNRWYARDCEIREVSTKEGVAFESENCFYGKRGASLRLGAYSKKDKNGVPSGTLLMLYSFGRNHFAKTRDNIEIIRVGTRLRSQVVGGASKIFKHFIKEYPSITVGSTEIDVKNIRFYVDYDHNSGSGIESLGFEFVTSGAGFMNYWTETGQVKHREPARHKEIMKLQSEGKILPICLAGTKTYDFKVK